MSAVPNAYDPSWEVQQAVVALWRADTALVALLGSADRIVDFNAERTAYPCVVYGELDEQMPWDTSTELGGDLMVQAGVWSEKEGRKEIRAIQRRLYLSLYDNEAALTLTGHRVVHFRQLLQTAVREPDGQYYHGVQRFNFKTEEI